MGVECSAPARRITAPPPLMAMPCRTFLVNIVPEIHIGRLEYRSCMLHKHPRSRGTPPDQQRTGPSFALWTRHDSTMLAVLRGGVRGGGKRGFYRG